MILKLIQYLWNGILLICGICIISFCGKYSYEFLSTSHAFNDWCFGLIMGVVMIGLLAILGWLVFSLINPNNKNSFGNDL